MPKSVSAQCKFCNSVKTVKRGLRKIKTGTRQIYYCRSCKKRFSLSGLPLFSYPVKAIISALIFYYLGYSLAETQSRIKGRFKISPSVPTVLKWIKRFDKYTPIKNERDTIKKFNKPHKMITRKLLEHQQRYLFQVHSYKAEKLHSSLNNLKSYLFSILNEDTQINPSDFGSRASSLNVKIAPFKITPRKSYSCKIADIALKAARNNYERHSVLQRFFLATDKATVAVEVPVFLTNTESKNVLKKSGGLLGHIDFLQVFDKNILILDYKPDASKDRAAYLQLVLYAIALSKRTSIHLKNIQCAWFDEKDYFIFSALKGYFKLKEFVKN